MILKVFRHGLAFIQHGSVGVSETLVDVTDLKCSAGDVVSFDLDPMYARGCVRQYR